MTTLTWDNALHISAGTAQRLGITNETLVELSFNGGVLQAPVWIVPGQPDDSVMLSVGYGRTRAGRVGNGAGVNAYLLRTSGTFDYGSGLQIRPTGQVHKLAATQRHFSLETRALVRSATLEEFLEHPDFAQDQQHTAVEPEELEPETGQESSEELHPVPEPPSLYPEHKYDGHAWGMAINLNACIGCNACVAACQSENNIPVVGKESVIRSREMHWLKVDRYYEGDVDNPTTYFQPRPCMHCENAPCEPVCPVQATSHSSEGLNEMTYNRCVGTRYCSNNCPYKVRRFNFLDYTEQDKIPVLQLMSNPDVTIRARGVMEKCTYCVQRINHGRIESEKAGRPIRDGEVKTACQEVCPTQAIIFGDINDENSEVARLKTTSLNYSMLAELGTQPRTSYLERLQNPNPEITTE
jgi:molybdopterin-containing oxidoreductase family iron-sulfur binding subunit